MWCRYPCRWARSAVVNLLIGRALKGVAVLLVAMAFVTPVRAEEQYRINIGDRIEFDILDDREPPQSFIVGAEGDIQLPLIGGVPIYGLTLIEAREAVQATYVAREIYKNPTVELSIVQYRQIFVLGDVRSPGAYDFLPFISAEQALGLAGGPSTAANNEEERILERSRLLGLVRSVNLDIARASVKYARVQAQLRYYNDIAWDDIPAEFKPSIDQDQFELLKVEEKRLLTLDESDHRERVALVEEAIGKVAYEIALLQEREAIEAEALEAVREQLELDEGLVSRGLTTRSTVLDSERDLARASTDLLALREDISTAERQLLDLRAEASELESARETRLRLELQDRADEMNSLIARRESLLERLSLLGRWIEASSNGEAELQIDYHVRRRSREGGIATLEVDAFAELLPGDLLVVTVRPSGVGREYSQ